MLATLVHEVPSGDAWAYEMKWDGVRAFVLVDGVSAGGRVRVTNRKGGDITISTASLEIDGMSDASTGILATSGGTGLIDRHVQFVGALRAAGLPVSILMMSSISEDRYAGRAAFSGLPRRKLPGCAAA